MAKKKESKVVESIQESEEILNNANPNNVYAVSLFTTIDKKSHALLVKLDLNSNTFEVVEDDVRGSLVKAATKMKLNIKNKLLNQKGE